MAPRAGVGASSRPAAAARGRRAPTAPAPGACPGRRGGSGGGPDDTGRSAGAVALDLAEHPHRGPGAYGPGAAGPPSHRGAAGRRRGLARAGHAHDRRGGGASRSGCPMALSQPRGDRVAACGATGPCRGGDTAGTRGPVGPEGADRPTAGTAGTRTDARLSGHAARPAVSLGGVRCPAPSGRGQWGERSRPRPRGGGIPPTLVGAPGHGGVSAGPRGPHHGRWRGEPGPAPALGAGRTPTARRGARERALRPALASGDQAVDAERTSEVLSSDRAGAGAAGAPARGGRQGPGSSHDHHGSHHPSRVGEARLAHRYAGPSCGPAAPASLARAVAWQGGALCHHTAPAESVANGQLFIYGS